MNRRAITAVVTGAIVATIGIAVPVQAASADTELAANARAIVASHNLIDSSSNPHAHHLIAELTAIGKGDLYYSSLSGEKRACHLDPALVDFVKVLTVDSDHQVSINNWNEWCDDSGSISSHQGGNALDIYSYAGHHINDGGNSSVGRNLIGHFFDVMAKSEWMSSRTGRVAQADMRNPAVAGRPSNVKEVNIGDDGTGSLHFDIARK